VIDADRVKLVHGASEEKMVGTEGEVTTTSEKEQVA